MPLFSMGKQEKLAWAQPWATRPNSFQPGEGFHCSDSEGRQSCSSLCNVPADTPGGKGAVQVLHMSYRNGNVVTVTATQEGQINFLRLPKHSVWTPAPPGSWVSLRAQWGLTFRNTITLTLLPLISALSALSKVCNRYLESRKVGVWH